MIVDTAMINYQRITDIQTDAEMVFKFYTPEF